MGSTLGTREENQDKSKLQPSNNSVHGLTPSRPPAQRFDSGWSTPWVASPLGTLGLGFCESTSASIRASTAKGTILLHRSIALSASNSSGMGEFRTQWPWRNPIEIAGTTCARRRTYPS